MAWSAIGILCDKCGKPTRIVGADCSADGELRFFGDCDDCDVRTQWRVFASQIFWQALRNDLAREQLEAKQKPRCPIKPQLKLPSPQLTDDDKGFLKERGIVWDQEGDGARDEMR